jgi:hypothetical protein
MVKFLKKPPHYHPRDSRLMDGGELFADAHYPDGDQIRDLESRVSKLEDVTGKLLGMLIDANVGDIHARLGELFHGIEAVKKD